MTFRFEPCDAVIGARASGPSLESVPSPDTFAEIEIALERFGVLIFSGQEISPKQQIAFSELFGPLAPTERDAARLDGYPEIFVVGNTRDQPVTFAPADPGGELEWHSDHIHRKRPARASLLYAHEVPTIGGDTLFACMYEAFETLSATQQTQYEQLQVIHSPAGLRAYLHGQGHRTNPGDYRTGKEDEVVWPLVRVHPLTGRKGLYFGNQVSIGIVGWPDDEALDFIAQLTEHACQEAFQYRHRWAVGDAVLWDNRRVLHAGTPYDLKTERRRLHRTTIWETEPIVPV